MEKIMARDRFKEQVKKNLNIFRTELLPYTFVINAYDTNGDISLKICSEEIHLPHLLGLQEIAPYLKGAPGVKSIEKDKITTARLYSSPMNSKTRKHIIDKNNYFNFSPKILSYNKPIYLYKNKNTTLFDCDYLMVKKVQVNSSQNAYVHVGIKDSLVGNIYVLNSILVTYDTDLNYDIFFKGQPVYTIKKITKTCAAGTEITYLERDKINFEQQKITKSLHKKSVLVTSKLVKNIDRINRKTNRINEISDITDLYRNKDNIDDARLKKLVIETFGLIDHKSNKEKRA